MIVAIDTSTKATVVALCTAQGEVRWADATLGAGRHGDELLPRLQAGLAALGSGPSEVGLIAVGVGPGSFTGLRIGLATIQGWALAQGTPVCGVPSPLAVAAPLLDGGACRVAVLGDAFKGEVALSIYTRDAAGGESPAEVRCEVAPCAKSPAAALVELVELVELGGLGGLGGLPASSPLTVAGDGYRRYADAFTGLVEQAHVTVAPESADIPDAAWLVAEALRQRAAGKACDARSIRPYYVRDADAKLPAVPLKL